VHEEGEQPHFWLEKLRNPYSWSESIDCENEVLGNPLINWRSYSQKKEEKDLSVGFQSVFFVFFPESVHNSSSVNFFTNRQLIWKSAVPIVVANVFGLSSWFPPGADPLFPWKPSRPLTWNAGFYQLLTLLMLGFSSCTTLNLAFHFIHWWLLELLSI
jgi:hypothetical protein